MPSEPDDSFDFLPSVAESQEPRPSALKPGLPPPSKRGDFPFLIADHSFDAHSLDAEKHQRDPHAVCLSFEQSELAYVHFIHPSGWGDVTLVKSGDRGWIPVDYFSSFSDSRAISVLAATAAFIAQPRSQKLYVAPQRVYTFSEAAINEIISGTKLLLTKTGVLSRESDLVQEYTDIAVARKSLLSELAHLVHVAKNNKHTSDPEIIDKLVRGCYRLLERTLALLRAVDSHPPLRETQSSTTRASSGSSRSTVSSKSSLVSAKSSFSDLQGHALYRMNSFTDYENPPLAEARLYEISDAFDDYLSHFLDPNEVLLAEPENPNTPSVILALTRHCMLACRELLVVVDSIPEAQKVESSKKEYLLEEIRRLVSCARSVVAALPPSPASLRVAAAQSMAVTAGRCQSLAIEIIETCMKYLKDAPELPLPSNRSYPIFQISEENDTATPAETSVADASVAGASIVNGKIVSANTLKEAEHDSSADKTPVLSNSGTIMNIQEAASSPEMKPISPQVSPKSELGPARVRPKPAEDSSFDTSLANSSFSSSFDASTKRGASAADTSNISLPEPNTSLQESANHSLHSLLSDSDANVSGSHLNGARATESQSTLYDLNHSQISVTNSDEEQDDNDDALVMRNGRVRGGTLTALVKWLTGDQFANLELEIRAFLLTFRLFTTPRDLTIELGTLQISEGVQHLCKLWLESFWEPEDNVLKSLAPMVPADLVSARKKLISDGKKFAQIVDLPIQPAGLNPVHHEKRSLSSSSTSSASSSVVSLPAHLRWTQSSGFNSQSALNLAASFREFGLGARRASRQVSGEESRLGRLRAGSQPNLMSGGGDTTGFRVITSDAAELFLAKPVIDLAAQLTLMWFDIFKMLRPSELLDQRFASSKRSLGLAPHVTQLVLSSNHLTAFVGDTILSPELSSKQRVRVLKHWIRVADELFNIGNLNGTVTIVLTLQSTRIVRLSKAWESLGNKSQTMLARLVPLTSPERNFNEYRKEIRNRQGTPCIPYMGILLGDLTFIDEGNPKFLKPSKKINFDRYMKTAIAISAVQPFQKSQFTRCTSDPVLQSWLRGQMAKSYSLDTRDAEDQWRRSLLIQPAD